MCAISVNSTNVHIYFLLEFPVLQDLLSLPSTSQSPIKQFKPGPAWIFNTYKLKNNGVLILCTFQLIYFYNAVYTWTFVYFNNYGGSF